MKAKDDAHKAILERLETEHAAAMKRLEEEYAAVMKRKERMEKEHAAAMKRKDEEYAALIKRKERLDKEHAAAMKRTDGEHSAAVKILERLKKKHAAAMKTKYNAVIPERLAAMNDDQRLPQEMKVGCISSECGCVLTMFPSQVDGEISRLVACMEEMFTVADFVFFYVDNVFF